VLRIECGDYMWNAIYHSVTNPGAWRIGSKGEDLGKSGYVGDGNQRKKLVVGHVIEARKNALRPSSSEGAG
jgi:hypothetical protein